MFTPSCMLCLSRETYNVVFVVLEIWAITHKQPSKSLVVSGYATFLTQPFQRRHFWCSFFGAKDQDDNLYFLKNSNIFSQYYFVVACIQYSNSLPPPFFFPLSNKVLTILTISCGIRSGHVSMINVRISPAAILRPFYGKIFVQTQ